MKRLLLVLTGFALLLFSSTKGWGLPPCPAERHPTTSPWSDCFGTHVYTNGDKYVGEFKDNKRHGQGTYRHNSGNKYVGGYKDGKKHGKGTVTFANGDKFIGTFKEGKVRWSQKMGKLPH